MARKARPPRSAGFVKKDIVEGLVKRLTALNNEVLRKHMEYMSDVRDTKDGIKAVYDEAERSGIPKRALKAVMKAVELEEKAEAQRTNLEDSDLIDKFDAIRHALGHLGGTVAGGNVVKLTSEAHPTAH